jgi:predicted CXXCH cytochrome family protein
LVTFAMAEVPKTLKQDLKPLPTTEKAASIHAPFSADDCRLCHVNADPKNPGGLLKPGNELCLECHEDSAKLLARKFVHAAATNSCVSCHNPHNSKEKKLLVEAGSSLCFKCHEDLKKVVAAAPVKHGALEQGAQCLSCHHPHGANVERLLLDKPGKLCVACHSQDNLKDQDGKPLTNFKKLLETHPKHHGPVADLDCSSCHNPHGFQNFRLLTKDYPAKFYSPYDPKLYALCFECHEENAFATAETDKLTQFRDGTRNLHHLHVNKAELGRTCRACHEVHAARQDHQMRESVPYGSSGWQLKINYTKTPTGGTCTKTCHAERSYTNRAGAAGKKE